MSSRSASHFRGMKCEARKFPNVWPARSENFPLMPCSYVCHGAELARPTNPFQSPRAKLFHYEQRYRQNTETISTFSYCVVCATKRRMFPSPCAAGSSGNGNYRQRTAGCGRVWTALLHRRYRYPARFGERNRQHFELSNARWGDRAPVRDYNCGSSPDTYRKSRKRVRDGNASANATCPASRIEDGRRRSLNGFRLGPLLFCQLSKLLKRNAFNVALASC